MKKLLMAAMMGISVVAFGQNPAFEVGDNVINAGFGFGGFYTGNTKILPISINYERGLLEDVFIDDLYLGVGGYLGFSQSEYITNTFFGTYGWRYNYTIVGARGALHYTFLDNLDTYFGLMLGYYNVSYKEIGNTTLPPGQTPASGSLFLSGYLGARYYFTESIGAFAELGWGVSALSLGVTLKF
jgi:hypothetical protein